MSTKAMLNEKGQVIVKLPSSGIEVTLRQPKGRDLKAMELASNAADKTAIGTMMMIISLLAVKPSMTLEEVEDLDADDVKELGDALANFRVFSTMG